MRAKIIISSKIKLYQVLAILCLGLIYSGSKAQDSVKVWRSDQPLIWADFTGPIDPTSTFEASTFTAIRYNYFWRLENGAYHIHFKTHGYLNKNRSWSKTDKQTDYLLSHEQLHVDINELYARKLQAVYEAGTYDAKDPILKEKIARLCTEMGNQKIDMQTKYDAETNHGKNRVAQHEWQLYIDAQMALTKPSDY